jgi:prepilin peptidase CpaA
MQYDWQSLFTSALIIVSAGVLLAAALHDIVARTVPNWMAVALALLGTALRAFDGSLLMGLLAGAIVFAAAAFCWRRGWFGGADVKLLGAAAIVVPPHEVLSFIAATAFAGAILGIAYLAGRSIASTPAPRRPDRIVARTLCVEHWRIRRGGPLPYACAIAAGFLFIVL